MRSALVLDVVMATALVPLLPIAPLVATALSRDVSYARTYRRSLVRAARHLRAQVRARAFSRYVFWREGAGSPTLTGACTHCGKCCLHRDCLFLEWNDSGQSRCRIYGTRFWKALACGRYPENGVDIRLYGCPSFQVAETDVPRPPPRGVVRPVIFVARRLSGLPTTADPVTDNVKTGN
ncbi:MAG: hypothetical protein KIT73_02365 [Burkholderiales bacterium]|nr:hypothetical protein [Burkholderiales bacterium]